MTRKLLILSGIIACLALTTGCQEFGKGGRIAATSLEQKAKDTVKAVERVLYYKPEAEQYKPIPYTFCYQTQSDINCYNQPLPEARGRLVGWQGRGKFNIEDTSRLPAKTALVRQPRAAERKTVIEDLAERIEKGEKKKKPELVSLEPVFVPEVAKSKTDKVVTIKVSEPDSKTLY